MSWERPQFERPIRPDRDPDEPERRHRFNPLLIFGVALFAVGAFYVLLIVVTIADDIFFPGNELNIGISGLPGIDSSQPEVADINERINIVFLGLDRRVGEPENQAARTDTVFVMTIDPYSKTGGVFSIPRDLVVEIPDGAGGYFQDRINTVWELGEFTYDDYDGGGPGLVKDTIEHNFDIPVDHYVILDFGDFRDLIDELDGIDIDVPEFEADYGYYDCYGCPTYPVEFYPGVEHMDGARALAYARIRKTSNDYKRIARQQLVIQATIKKALDTNLLTNALDLYGEYNDTVQTDISDLKIPGLAKLAEQIGVENLTMVGLVPPAVYPCDWCNFAGLLADPDQVEELKAQVFSDGKIQAEGALVELQNGTDTPGRAEELAGFLKKQGIPADDLLLQDAPSLFTQSLIVDRTGKAYTASKLAEWLNIPSDRVVVSTDPKAAAILGTGDIVVVIGSDAAPATAAVP